MSRPATTSIGFADSSSERLLVSLACIETSPASATMRFGTVSSSPSVAYAPPWIGSGACSLGE